MSTSPPATLLSASCTTGWTHWEHGLLLVTGSAIIRIPEPALTRQASVQGPLRLAYTTDRPAVDLNSPEWATLLHKPGVLHLDSSDIVSAHLSQGLQTDRLLLVTRTGERHKLLFLSSGYACDELATAFTQWGVPLTRSALPVRRGRSSTRGQAWNRHLVGALIAAAIAAFGLGLVINDYLTWHTLRSAGVQTASHVDSVGRSKSRRYCAITFDAAGQTRHETVEACGSLVQPGWTLNVVYDPTDPSTVWYRRKVMSSSEWFAQDWLGIPIAALFGAIGVQELRRWNKSR